MTDDLGRAAVAEPALVNQAAPHLGPSGFDPARELAERCEQAQGPDRELDVLIACAVKYRWEGWTDGDLAVEESLAKLGEQHVFDRAKNSHASIWRLLPAYTASLDAAMSPSETAKPATT